MIREISVRNKNKCDIEKFEKYANNQGKTSNIKIPKISFRTRIISVTAKDRGYKAVKRFERHMNNLKKGDNVIIKKGLMKNLQGTIASKPQILWNKKTARMKVRVRDVGKAIKFCAGTNKLYFMDKDIKPTHHRYKHIVAFSD